MYWTMTLKTKSKTTTTIIASVIIGLIMSSPITILPNVGAQTPSGIPSDSCKQQMEQAIFDAKSKLDQDKINSTALGYDDFSTKVANDNFKYQSMYGIFSLDIPNCTAKLKTVHAVFSVHDKNGKERQISVAEDPITLNPISTTVTNDVARQNTTDGHVWAGYEIMGSGTIRSVPVYQAEATWQIPSGSQPSIGHCSSTGVNSCIVSVWVGLTSYSGAKDGTTNGHMVQAGTESVVQNCSTTCVSSYDAWFEYLPDTENICSGMPSITATDVIDANVYSEGKTGGTVSNYDITVSDITKSQACSNIVNPHSFTAMGTPYYAQFINERPSFSGTPVTLAKYGSDTMSGTVYYGGATRAINLPYSGGWYNLMTMTNGGNSNIGVGSIGGSGQFALTWLTSNGT